MLSVKYQTDSLITDNLGRPAYRIFRFIRKNETQAWTPDATFMAVSTENQLEFIEIKSESPNFSLDGYVIVLFNGSSNGSDSSYLAIDLDGYQTDLNGLFLIGNNNVSPSAQIIIPNNSIQNGADAVAIYLAPLTDFHALGSSCATPSGAYPCDAIRTICASLFCGIACPSDFLNQTLLLRS